MRGLMLVACLVLVAACTSRPPTAVSTTTTSSTTTTTATTTTTTAPTTTTTAPTTTTTTVPPSTVVCGAANPVDLGYDPFYVYHCDALGISVMGSALVDPAAVEEAALIVEAMISHRPDVVAAMIANHLRVAVTAEFEFTSDMPEYADIYEIFPDTDWDWRARGLGATPFMPLSSVGEENVVCLPGDVYVGESIMVHEFAHTIHLMGLDFVDPTFTTRLIEAYDAAVAAGLWSNTYAGSDYREYWAEGVQSYFNVEEEGPVGGDGIQNEIDMSEELAVYDPALFSFIDEIFSGVEALPVCQ